MRNLRVSGVSLAAVVGIVVGLHAQTVPKPAPVKQTVARAPAKIVVPPAIDAAFKRAYPNAAIKTVSKEKENGREVYEVESIDNGRTRDLIYLADGSVVEVEEEVSDAQLPAPVAAAIKARYPKARVTKREKVTVTKGNVVQFEVALAGAKVAAVTLAPDGKWVSPK